MIPLSRKSSFLLGALLLAAVPPARADVRYTTQMTMGGPAKPGADADESELPPGMTMPGIRTTTYVKDMHERVETSLQLGPMKMDTVTLTLCDKHQSIKMDPGLKIYTIGPIGALSFAPPPTMGGRGMKMPEGKPGVGTVTTTLSAQDMGTEKVADQDAHHFKLSVRMQSDGCIGKTDSTLRLEEWVAPIKGGLSCPERYAPARTLTNEHGCQITYNFKGDLSALQDISGGMVVRMIIYGGDKGDKILAQQDLRECSTALLDDSLFAPPADFKEVSEQEFQKRQSDAMRKSIMGGMGSMFKPPADDGDTGDGGQTPPPVPEKKKRTKIPGLPF